MRLLLLRFSKTQYNFSKSHNVTNNPKTIKSIELKILKKIEQLTYKPKQVHAANYIC